MIPPQVISACNWTGGYVALRIGAARGDNFKAERSVAATPGNWEGTPWDLSVGYGVQRGSMVYGAALDYTGSAITANGTGSGAFVCLGGFCSTEVSNSVALRGRTGRAFDPTLTYGTAGFASGAAGGHVGIPKMGSDRMNGWVAGDGLEQAMGRSTTRSVEYLFTDLGRLELPTSCIVNCYTDESFGTIRLGPNLRF